MVTIVFCDLVGSTQLSQSIHAEELGEILVRFREIVVAAVDRYQGWLSRFIGDGVLLCFGYPVARENDSVNAICCALEIVEQVRLLASPERAPPGWRPAARVGVHTGVTLVGDLGSGGSTELDALVGEAPNIAARLQHEAPANGVVISAATHRLAGIRFDCVSRGPTSLKGVRDPIELFEVRSRRLVDDPLRLDPRSGSVLLGREAEFSLIASRCDLADKGGGQFGAILGEAGMGKSHLLRAAAQRALATGARLLATVCFAETSRNVLRPIVDLVRRELRLDQLDATAARAVLRSAMPDGDVSETGLDALALLLGLERQRDGTTPSLSSAHRDEALQALSRWVLHAPDRRWTLLAVEDLHWADASSIEFLAGLIDPLLGSRCVVLVTSRPGAPQFWRHRSHVFTVDLGRVSEPAVCAIIRSVVGETALDEDTIRGIAARSDGVPLFAEEIARAVSERTLQHAPVRTTVNADNVLIPPALQESLLSRLDGLGSAKEVAQTAAALGTVFQVELLRACWSGDPAELDEQIDALRRAEILVQHGTGRQRRLGFRHTLLREIAYHSLLRPRRRQLHRRALKALVSDFPDTAREHPELLASHAAAGGLADQAIRSWQIAARGAYSRSGFVEAVDILRSALGILHEVDTDAMRRSLEVSLQVELGTALIATRGEGSSEVERAFGRAEELLRSDTTSGLNFSALRGLQSFYQVRGPLDVSHRLAERLRRFAEEIDDPIARVEAYRRLGWCLFCLGEFAEGRRLLHAALDLYTQENAQRHIVEHSVDPAVLAHVNLAWLEAFMGAREAARERMRAAEEYARRLGHALSLAYALGISAAVYQTLGQTLDARRTAEETIVLAEERHLPYWRAIGWIVRGWARVCTGDHAGLEELEAGIAAYRSSGARLFTAYGLSLHADAMLRSGAPKQAAALAGMAELEITEVGSRFIEAEIHRLKAVALMSAGDTGGTGMPTDFAFAIERAENMRAGRIAEKIAEDLERLVPDRTAVVVSARARAEILIGECSRVRGPLQRE